MNEQRNIWHARREGKGKWTTYWPDSQLSDPETVAKCYAEDWCLDLSDGPEQRVEHYKIEVRDPRGNVTRWAVEVRAVPEFHARPA